MSLLIPKIEVIESFKVIEFLYYSLTAVKMNARIQRMLLTKRFLCCS